MAGMARFFVDGGPWMYPIALVSLVAAAVIFERIYFLYFVYSTKGSSLFPKVRQAVMANQLAQAIKACDATGKSALGHVLKSALLSADKGVNAQDGIDEGVLEMAPLVEKRGNMLSGLASLATLLGLLGTVMGLIEAFMIVADAPPDQKSVLLTRAISVAMNTTAFGLIVAIPAMFVQLSVSSRIKVIMDDIDNYSLKLVNLLSNRKK